MDEAEKNYLHMIQWRKVAETAECQRDEALRRCDEYQQGIEEFQAIIDEQEMRCILIAAATEALCRLYFGRGKR